MAFMWHLEGAAKAINVNFKVLFLHCEDHLIWRDYFNTIRYAYIYLLQVIAFKGHYE